MDDIKTITQSKYIYADIICFIIFGNEEQYKYEQTFKHHLVFVLELCVCAQVLRFYR
jgi:hypothetical protein